MVVASTLTTADIWMIAAIFAILIVLVFLAVAEMGLSRISRVKALALAEERDDRRSKALLALVERPERWVNPVLLTVNILQTIQATLTGIVANSLFGPLGVVVGVALNVVLFYVLAEAVPKTYAVMYSEKAALATARPVSVLVGFWPLKMVTRGLIGLTNVIVPGKGLRQGPFVSEREFLGIVEEAAKDEVIEYEERELIESVIEFGDTLAREIMVPRTDMVTVPAAATITEALDVAVEHGFSRLPVEGKDTDDIVGIAYTKDMMGAERQGKGFQPVAGLLRPAHFVPETKAVAPLMREMQTGRFHLAVLIDEHGGVAGLVTLEDLLEELVGDIVDEYDTEMPEVERLPDGSLSVDGGMPIDELGDLLGVRLPDDDWDTVGGFVLGCLGRVPEVGETVEHQGFRFTPQQMDGRRVARVHVAYPPEPAGEEVDGEGAPVGR